MALDLLFVVQRYGRDVRGGAEQACRELATRLAQRGHRVSVLTTTALAYTDWSPHYPVGQELLDGVQVHRLDARKRDLEAFERLNRRVTIAGLPVAMPLQRAWQQAQGPVVPDLVPWLDEHAAAYDVAAFFTYLYATTTEGLPAATRTTPTMLVPCAHDEIPLHLSVFDTVVHLADRLAFLTPEEADLFRARFRLTTMHEVLGLGTELDPEAGDEAAMRTQYCLGDDPYVLYLGRLDPIKGAWWLVESFARYKALRPGPLKLVLAGEAVQEVPHSDDVVVTGVVDDPTRTAALRSALALVHPSPYESFSMVLTEAWATSTPAVAYAGNPVLRGHVERSEGGLLFRSAADLGAALDLLLAEPERASALGRAGRRYVEHNYGWPVVIEHWERALQRAAACRVRSR